MSRPASRRRSGCGWSGYHDNPDPIWFASRAWRRVAGHPDPERRNRPANQEVHRMSEKTAWERFFDDHAPIYEDNMFTKNTAHEVHFLLEELHLPPRGSVLDVGC